MTNTEDDDERDEWPTIKRRQRIARTSDGKQAIKKAVGAGRAQRADSVRDHHRYVDSHRRTNRGVFINLEAISVKGGDKVYARLGLSMACYRDYSHSRSSAFFGYPLRGLDK
jgi:hypothetical protein